MECRYCQAANADDEHRCRRCGRRLRVGPVYTGSSAAAPVLQQSVAPVLQERAAPVLEAVEGRRDASGTAIATEQHRTPEPSAPRRPVTYQRALFPSREPPLVVQFDTIAPGLVQTAPHKQPSAPRPRKRKMVAGQQALPFAAR